MTNRIRTVTVTLDRDFRDDDLEAIVSILMGIKHVAHVQPGAIVSMKDHDARQEFQQKVLCDIMKILGLFAFGGLRKEEGQALANIRAELSKI